MVIHAVASHFTDWTVLYVCVCDPVCVFFNTKLYTTMHGRHHSPTVLLVLSNYPDPSYIKYSP